MNVGAKMSKLERQNLDYAIIRLLAAKNFLDKANFPTESEIVKNLVKVLEYKKNYEKNQGKS